jgi:thymidine phosphorylase
MKGEERGRLRELSVAFAAEALVAIEHTDRQEAARRAERALDDGSAAERLAWMIEAQGGDPRVVDDPWAVLPVAPVKHRVAGTSGYLVAVDAEALGRAAAALGAGRMKKGDPIDPALGIEFFPKIGDRLGGGDVAVVHARDEEGAAQADRRIREAMTIGDDPGMVPPLVYGWHGRTEGETG